MADRNLTCPECAGAMEEGFILDSTYGAKMVSRWVSGQPEPSWWQGLKTSGREARTIDTYRCVNCGFLKSYASHPSETLGMFSP